MLLRDQIVVTKVVYKIIDTIFVVISSLESHTDQIFNELTKFDQDLFCNNHRRNRPAMWIRVGYSNVGKWLIAIHIVRRNRIVEFLFSCADVSSINFCAAPWPQSFEYGHYYEVHNYAGEFA